jgi:2-polyprenyl-3-methyl-5-hydroxy-6-metoxy-1,4-benzoquinol methylase
VALFGHHGGFLLTFVDAKSKCLGGHRALRLPNHGSNPLPNPVRQVAMKLLNAYPKWKCKREFKTQTFVRYNERPVEFSFVFRKVAEIYPRTILDVGTGTTALPHLLRNCGPLVTAIDNVRDYWSAGMVNRHYHIVDDDITNTRLRDKYDFITCISVLEHIQKADLAVAQMFSLLKPGGHLLMTFPYNEKEYVRNVYELAGSSYGHGVPYITQSFSRGELDGWLHQNGGTIVDQEYWKFWDGGHWTVGNQIVPPEPASAETPHQLSCVLIKKTAAGGIPA